MTAMTCKLSGLFSIGEDFDDEDLLRTDWAVRSASGPADVAAAVSSCALRPSSVASKEPLRNGPQRSGGRSAAPGDGTASRSGPHMANPISTAAAVVAAATTTAAGQTVAPRLRQLSSSSSDARAPSLRPPMQDICQPNLASHQSRPSSQMQQKPHAAQDDFDDWDIDLADLDECDRQMDQPPPPPAHTVPHVAKTLRPPACPGVQRQGPALPISSAPAAQVQYTKPRPSFPSAPQQRLAASTAASPAPGSFSRTVNKPHTTWATPGPSHQTHGLFETISPASSPSTTSLNSPAATSHPLHTPLLTNRLVRLVSASNKLPKKRPRSEPRQPRTRRFPGPAGFLPEQMQDQNLDDIVVSVPQTPAHGAMARSPSQGCSSQSEEEDFRGGGWAAMKAEMGLDERNPSCFLHSYSIVMVLRKAALKQLAKNKVPNMAVLLKSIICTHADAKAVFKDPTGEIQGTVHRRLLEDRVGELKVGAVLLLKQVGVFSPSHRNCYLNVTPNNLLKIYSPDGESLSSQPSSLVPEPSPGCPRGTLREPMCQMQLVFDDEDDNDEGQGGDRNAEHSKTAPTLSDGKVRGRSSPRGSAGNATSLDWDADDDLDELLGELPEDTYSI